MNKNDMNIMSYDGQDAFYSGTDEEYAEFLRQARERVDFAMHDIDPEPVDNTQRINLNETINLQNVIDKFKKTAGDIGQGAKALKENVVSKVDKFMTKKPEAETDAPDEYTAENNASQINSARQFDELKGEMKAMADIPNQVGGVDMKLDGVSASVASLSKQLASLSNQIAELEERLASEDGGADIAAEIKTISTDISDIRQSVGSVSKLNDSIFDLKNTQLNTKNSVSNLETAFVRLKKKCVLGITVVSILSAIIIALEILLMLS